MVGKVVSLFDLVSKYQWCYDQVDWSLKNGVIEPAGRARYRLLQPISVPVDPSKKAAA